MMAWRKVYLDEIEAPEPEDVERLVDRLKPVLRGESPIVQGAALADCLSLWLAGHPRFMRRQLLADLVDLIEGLTPESERALFGPAGHPDNAKEGD